LKLIFGSHVPVAAYGLLDRPVGDGQAQRLRRRRFIARSIS
jgi:hypothetical protein